MTVVLLALVTDFSIWKGLVISSTTNNQQLANGEETITPADVKSQVDVEEPLVICYK